MGFWRVSTADKTFLLSSASERPQRGNQFAKVFEGSSRLFNKVIYRVTELAGGVRNDVPGSGKILDLQPRAGAITMQCSHCDTSLPSPSISMLSIRAETHNDTVVEYDSFKGSLW